MAKSMVERSKRWGRGRVAVLLLATTAVSGCAVSDVPIFANNPNFDVNSRWASYLAENPGMVDLAPTILSLFGVDKPLHMDGESIFKGNPFDDAPPGPSGDEKDSEKEKEPALA